MVMSCDVVTHEVFGTTSGGQPVTCDARGRGGLPLTWLCHVIHGLCVDGSCLCVAMEQARRRKVRRTQLRQELAKLESIQLSVETRGVEIERQLRGKEVR